jgi:hypothetical protein
MPRSKGLQVSLAGGLIFLPSVIGLLFLPALLATVGMLVGGMLVWSGFIMTLFSFYSGQDDGDGDA